VKPAPCAGLTQGPPEITGLGDHRVAGLGLTVGRCLIPCLSVEIDNEGRAAAYLRRR
jgi:hypothetical protein